MGTRGAFGFRIDGEDKLTYNHYDSYPEGLGQDMMDFVRDVRQALTPKELVEKVRAIRMVREDSETPTPAEIEKYKKWSNKNVGEGTGWYSLLRELQGNPQGILEAGVMVESSSFVEDSLFCEWAYVLNLDNETFEIYEGFQKEPHTKGRYAKRETPQNERRDSSYYPVALLKVIPLGSMTDISEHIAFNEPLDKWEALP